MACRDGVQIARESRGHAEAAIGGETLKNIEENGRMALGRFRPSTSRPLLLSDNSELLSFPDILHE
jgi:hypothetical protein